MPYVLNSSSGEVANSTMEGAAEETVTANPEIGDQPEVESEMWDPYYSDWSYWFCEYCYPELQYGDEEASSYDLAKAMGPSKYTMENRVGHTYRMRKEFNRHHFKKHSVLYRYLNTPRTVNDLRSAHNLADRFIQDEIEDGLSHNAPHDDRLVPFSMDKRKRWLLPNHLLTVIFEMDRDMSDHDVAMGIREYWPSMEDRAPEDLAVSYASTWGKEKRFSHGRGNSRMSDLAKNQEPERKFSKHDWKPVLQKMTHNQHFRGVQRKQILRQGYRRTLRNALKEEAEKRAYDELRSTDQDKTEVAYSVFTDDEHWYDRPPVDASTPASKYTRKGGFRYWCNEHDKLQKLSKLSGSMAAKNVTNIFYETEDYFDGLCDEDDGFYDEFDDCEPAVKAPRVIALNDFVVDEKRDEKWEEFGSPDDSDSGLESYSNASSQSDDTIQDEVLDCLRMENSDQAEDSSFLARGTYESEESERKEMTLADFIIKIPAKKAKKRKNLNTLRPDKVFKYKPEKPEPKAKKPSTSHESDSIPVETIEPVYVPVEVPKSKIVLVADDHLKPERLAGKYGRRYIEGECQPRRFSIRLTEDVNPVCVLFQIREQFESGMSEVAIRLHGKDKECFYSEMEDLDDIVTVGDVVNSAVAYVPQTPTIEKRAPLGFKKLDMRRLNQILNQDVEICCREDAMMYQAQRRVPHQNALSNATSAPIETDFEIYCDICYRDCVGDTFSNCWTRLDRCGHCYCNECWSHHLSSRVHRQDTALMCPAHKCDTTVDPATVLSLVDDATYRLYERLRLELAIERSPKWQWCPNSKCGRLAHKIDAETRYGLNVSCACGHCWCFSCQNEAHWPATCEQAEQYTKDLEEVGALIATFTVPISSVDVKKCPTCSYPIEKYLGCNQMFCSLCGSFFCWRCLTPSKEFIHNCTERHQETVYLVDVLPQKMRWVNEAIQRRARWQTQFQYLARNSKSIRGITNKSNNSKFRRRVCESSFGADVLATLRVFHHVIEHVMVVFMSCKSRRNVNHMLRNAYQNLLFITERLETFILVSCSVGQISKDIQKRVPKLITTAEENLAIIKRELYRQEVIASSQNATQS